MFLFELPLLCGDHCRIMERLKFFLIVPLVQMREIVNIADAGQCVEIFVQIPPVIALLHTEAVRISAFRTAPGRDLYYIIGIWLANAVTAFWVKE